MNRFTYLALGVGALAIPGFVDSTYYMRLINWALIVAVLAFALNIIFGYAGQISLGHLSFYGIGAYAAGILMVDYGMSFWLALLIAMLVTAAIGVLVGLPALRLRDFYLAVATLGFAVIVHVLLGRWIALTGGQTGLISIPRPYVLGFELFEDHHFYYFSLVLFLAAFWFTDLISRSAYGRNLRAIRENENAARSLGVNISGHKLLAFAFSTALAGAAGAGYATLNGYIHPNSFTAGHSILFLAVLVIAGLGSHLGAILAGVLTVIVPEMLRSLGDYQLWGYSVVLILVLYFLPRGIAGLISDIVLRVFHLRGSTATDAIEVGPDELEPIARSGFGAPSRFVQGGANTSAPFLNVVQVSKSFGGLMAVSDLSMRVSSGEVVGLIGPNGAGKSTAINLITGVLAPTSGKVDLGHERISGLRPDKVVRKGVARTFQTPQLFEDLTVLENVLVGMNGRRGLARLVARLLPFPAYRREEADAKREAIALLQSLDLARLKYEKAANVPFGQRRLVEIARALATRPKILLLDEPAAGLNDNEARQLKTILRDLAAAGIGVLLVEHKMSLVMEVCDRIVVLNFGQNLSEGTPAEVSRDEAVREAYLGRVG
ncbi:branched-chain amino acid ABC transporter ATP-binding protein/permease [Oceanibacterium hippocampi]|uniref:Lipopolysaccharide export system ATP-binding protein LptB n=1 Tax=Oceanibacterium hippocampi TaxID=745714 RepID=A0A1Y5TVT6_9PROT|nr:branched-chain amino acid ABC transporter ATP-binding protein/permease [Oceanibacterium hippocampi]SLN74039.1 Lipopolysaccharide export system ATP-binding protein LptB [Oceanibacterium hippocampi]